MYFIRFFLAVLTTSLIAINSFAIEEIIVTGAYSPISSDQLSSSVTILDQQHLLQLSQHSLLDALRQVPGIWVEEQGGSGGVTSISLRGAESNHTLILLDGVQLNDPTNTRGGAFDIGNINIETIERIEIIRGAQSSIYGSDALAGVIQIFTLSADKKSTRFNGSIGEDGYKTSGFSTSNTLNNIGYAFTAQVKNAGEPVSGDTDLGSTAKNKELIGKLQWSQEQQNIDVSYRYFDGERTSFPEQSGGPLFAVNRQLDASQFTDQSSAAEWQIQVNDFWISRTNATWYNRVENLTSPGIIPFDAVPPNGANTDFTRTQFSWVNTLGNNKTAWSNIGLETKHENGMSKGYLDFGAASGISNLTPTDFKMSRTLNSIFINLNGFVNEKLLLQGNLRRDDAENIAAENSFQMGFRNAINDSSTWFANKGKGFKLPSFFALGHPLVGNSNLFPELAKTWDTGFEWRKNTLTTRISYFENQFINLIDFDSTTFQNVNRTRVDSSGIEAELSWQANNQWWLQVHGSYTDIDMLSSNNHLLGRPQVTAGSTASYLISNEWSLNLNYLWVDERFAVSRYTGNGLEETLDSYSRLDANIHYQATNKIQIGFSIDNVFDKNYNNDIGFPNESLASKIGIVITL